jgi:hypothetical protein
VETNNINYITIQRYLEGLLDEKAMHELEKKALDDPFLADALEGYSKINSHASKHLSLLQLQLEERIAKQQENKNTFQFSWQRLSIAATAGLLCIIVSILFWFKSQQAVPNNGPKQVDVNLTLPASMEVPEPVLGWKNYNEYLNKSVDSLKGKVSSGKVIISFMVSPDKELSRIRIVEGLDESTNKEALRLIKSGPQWQSGKNPNTQVTIQFK